MNQKNIYFNCKLLAIKVADKKLNYISIPPPQKDLIT